MMKLLQYFLPLSVCVFLTGCINIQFPQLEIVKQALSTTEPVDVLDEFRWELNFGAYKSIVYLVNLDDKQVFVNKSDDILFFNQGLLTEVKNLSGETHDIKMTNSVKADNSNSYFFVYMDQIQVTHQCTGWYNVSMLIKEQNCSSSSSPVRFSNTKEYNEKLELIKITQWFSNFDTPLVITKKVVGNS